MCYLIPKIRISAENCFTSNTEVMSLMPLIYWLGKALLLISYCRWLLDSFHMLLNYAILDTRGNLMIQEKSIK